MKGLFNSTVELNQNVKKQMKRWENENIRNSATPMLCTLYAVNLEASSVSSGTMDVASYIGVDSPIRYNKIKNFRILVDSEIFGPDTKENWGFEIDSQLNILFYPGLANAEDNSIIVLHNMPNLYFRVTNSNLSRAMPNTYVQSQLTVHFVKNDVDKNYLTLETQVVKNYTLDKYNDGAYVIADEVILKKNELNEVLEDAIDTYNATFFDKSLNSIALKTSNSILYDPYLQHFLHKNKVLATIDYSKFLLTSREVMQDEKFDLLYKRSIFGRIERKKTMKGSAYQFYTYKFYSNAEDLSWSRLYEYFNTHDINIITRIEGASPKDIIPNALDPLDIIMDTYLTTPDITNLKSTIFNEIYDFDLDETHEHMVKFALCIFILKQKINSLIGRNMDSNIVEEVV